nr:Ppx/GppA phosphatase family protein [Kaistia hirudinis]
MTISGEDPHRADSGAPVTGPPVDRADLVGKGVAARPPEGGAPGGGKRKGRRRSKKRGPVFAPGQPRPPAGRAEDARPAAQKAAPAAAPRPNSAVSNPVTMRSGGRDGLYAALDLGTNNCRLLIAQPRERGFRVVDAFSRIVRLGEGVGSSGRLGEAAMERAVEALRICSAKLKDRGVRRTRLVATEACRLADNGRTFLDRVRRETGLSLEIVSRETEARLAVSGCASLIDPTTNGALLFDIGGGSSELVWVDLTRPAERHRRRMSDRIRTWASLPVGVVTLSERHGGEMVTPDVFEAMVAEVADMLLAFPDAAALDTAVSAGKLHMLGTSGTVTTLAGVHLGLPRYDRRKVDGTWMSAGEVDRMMTLVTGMDYQARIANPCIGRERADLVLAGCAILEAIRRRWPCERLRVADRGLREGILVEMMTEDGVWRRPQTPRTERPA